MKMKISLFFQHSLRVPRVIPLAGVFGVGQPLSCGAGRLCCWHGFVCRVTGWAGLSQGWCVPEWDKATEGS